MSERDRGDRPKKSWRELDAQRDRAAPRPPRDSSERRNPNDSGMDARASKQYRAALDALFAKGEVGKLAEKLSGGPGMSRANAVDLVTGKTPEPPRPPAAPAAPTSTPEREPPRAAPAAAAAPAKDPKDEGRAALRKKVLEALGRDEISRAIDRYVKAHGWPNDFEILEQALEHHKDARQTEAMEHLERLLAKEKPKRSRSLAGKLRFIEETSDSTELREQAARIRGKL
jgi:hypothetical protein